MPRHARATTALVLALTAVLVLPVFAVDTSPVKPEEPKPLEPNPADRKPFETNPLKPGELTQGRPIPGTNTPLIGTDFLTMEAVQNAANYTPGPRQVPGRKIPLPSTISEAFRIQVAAPYRIPDWDAHPKTDEDWNALVAKLAENGAAKLPALRDKLGVTIEPTTLGGVKAYVLQPKSLPDAHKNKIVFAIHGGGYVYNPGEAGTLEGTLMAGLGGYKVIAIDYRMAPDHPYPAAMDDAMAAYKALLRQAKPGSVAVVGTSAGGAMALALCLRAKADGVALPAVVAPGTPEADLTGAGDTVQTNEWLDNVIVSFDGYIANAIKLYAAGHDLHDPQLSPIFGDFKGLPPMILTSGTRDLFLSNTVRVHRKLRQAGVEAELQVFEGMSHAQYLFDADAPETKEVFAEITRFFDKHLSN